MKLPSWKVEGKPPLTWDKPSVALRMSAHWNEANLGAKRRVVTRQESCNGLSYSIDSSSEAFTSLCLSYRSTKNAARVAYRGVSGTTELEESSRRRLRCVAPPNHAAQCKGLPRRQNCMLDISQHGTAQCIRVDLVHLWLFAGFSDIYQ